MHYRYAFVIRHSGMRDNDLLRKGGPAAPNHFGPVEAPSQIATKSQHP